MTLTPAPGAAHAESVDHGFKPSGGGFAQRRPQHDGGAGPRDLLAFRHGLCRHRQRLSPPEQRALQGSWGSCLSPMPPLPR